ncbi:carboxymuconolactone decarboxylase family protein [Pseudonocardia sp. GCM10023141]|uniref:carboxymuconolactone decarboxylase family protein n=1 Tax=Pseudonocardia sp. GCM10023141 TaxID=3252653 RepID=UPI0036186032
MNSRLRWATINGCGYCVDAHAKELAAAGEPAVRINLVAAWRESTVFTEIAMINAANRLLTITHTKGGSYEPGTFDRMTDAGSIVGPPGSQGRLRPRP